MPLSLLSKTWMAIIMAIGSPWFDDPRPIISDNWRPENTQTRLPISPAGTTGAANARAEKRAKRATTKSVGTLKRIFLGFFERTVCVRNRGRGHKKSETMIAEDYDGWEIDW